MYILFENMKFQRPCQFPKGIANLDVSSQSPYRTVLRDNAVPTIFDLTSHLNNPHSRHRKRIKELVSF